VKLSLNGVPLDKLGGLSIGDLTTEVTKRLGGYAERVLMLVSYASETQDLLGFESDVLDAWLGGYGVDAGKVEGATNLDALAVLSAAPMPPGAKPAATPKAPSGPRSPGGLALASCGKKAGKKRVEKTEAAADPPAEPDKDKDDKDKAAAKAKPGKDKPGKDKPHALAAATHAKDHPAPKSDDAPKPPPARPAQPAGAADCPAAIVQNGVRKCL
jgi:hypothetical protein